MARHAIHVTEVLTASIATVEAMQKYQASLYSYESLKGEIGATAALQSSEYIEFQLQVLKNLKLRSESNDRRLVNEISSVEQSLPIPLLHLGSKITN